jgi:hypothetical protein
MPDYLDRLGQQLTYLVTLPERTIRSLAAAAGGTMSLLTETLFPESLRGTTLYRTFLGGTQQFILEKIAQVRPETDASKPAEAADPQLWSEPASTRPDESRPAGAGDPQYLPKKIIGTALETAGLFAMHFSPLWVFAIAGDAAAGSGAFLARLVEQLKWNGVLPPEANISGLADLLAAIQDTARKSATAIDTPPLSREELTRLANDMTGAYGRMFGNAANLLPRLETLRAQMEQIASRDNISMEKLGGILSIDVAQWGRKGIGAVLAVGQAGADLFGEKILDSYARTLEVISQEGATEYLNRRMTPFLQAAADHFDPELRTWTGSLVARWLGGAEQAGDADPAPDAKPSDGGPAADAGPPASG